MPSDWPEMFALTIVKLNVWLPSEAFMLALLPIVAIVPLAAFIKKTVTFVMLVVEFAETFTITTIDVVVPLLMVRFAPSGGVKIVTTGIAASTTADTM